MVQVLCIPRTYQVEFLIHSAFAQKVKNDPLIELVTYEDIYRGGIKMNVKSNVQKLEERCYFQLQRCHASGLIMRLSADDMLNIPVLVQLEMPFLETRISYLL